MKNLKYILIIVWGVFSFASCDDFLDETPDNRTVLDSPQAMSELLVSAYPEAAYQGLAEAMSDNAGDKGASQRVAEYIVNEDSYYWRESGSEQYDTPVFYWNACYAGIAATNHVLDAIEGVDNKDDYSAQKGEALAIRAYNHFMLVNLFAKTYNPETAETDLGVPYVDKSETVVYGEYKRASVKTVYENIEKDLKDALSLVRDDSYTVPKYHFTMSALYAFASRFYLYKGEWDKVIEYSDKALGADAASKLRDWNGKYLTYTANELWAQYTKAEEASNMLLARQYSQWGSGAVVFRYSLSPAKITELFGQEISGEMRFNLAFSDKILYAAGDQNLGFLPKVKPRTESHGDNPDIGFSNAVFPLFTAEEVLFNRAEAYVMSNNKDYGSALADIDTYLSKRSKSYNPANKIDLDKIKDAYAKVAPQDISSFYAIDADQKWYLSYLLDLRRREFIHEGMRWFDLRRYNIEVVHDVVDGASITLPKNDLRRVIQIPAQAIAIGLKANPR